MSRPLATFLVAILHFLCSITTSASSLEAGKWHAIPSQERSVEVAGETFDITPRCTSTTGNSTTHYSFIRPSPSGDTSKLIFLLMGGGGCWSEDTCLYDNGKPFVDGLLYYTGEKWIRILEDPNEAVPGWRTGIAGNPESPYADYNAVLVMYCTGDSHIGHREVLLSNPDKSQLMNFFGFDNFLSSLELAGRHFPVEDVKQMVFGGLSSGGFGTAVLAPYALEYYNKAAKNSLIVVDHSVPLVLPTVALFTTFLDLVGGFPSIPKWVCPNNNCPNDITTLDLFYLVARKYPQTRFAFTHPMFDEYLSAMYTLALFPDITKYPASRPIEALTAWASDELQCLWAASTNAMLVNMRRCLPNVRVFEHAGSTLVMAFDERVFSTNSTKTFRHHKRNAEMKSKKNQGRSKKGRRKSKKYYGTKKKDGKKSQNNHRTEGSDSGEYPEILLAIDWFLDLQSPDRSNGSRGPIRTPSATCVDEESGSLDKCVIPSMRVNMVRQLLFKAPLKSCDSFTDGHPKSFSCEEPDIPVQLLSADELESLSEGGTTSPALEETLTGILEDPDLPL